MAFPSDDVSLGPVLVIGGCGFIGFHIVRQLVEENCCTSIAVLSRNPVKNLLSGVSYYAGDVTLKKSIQSVLDLVKPTVVFHVASPPSYGSDGDEASFHRVNVIGTENVLSCAAATHSVKALVYTSSMSVMAGNSLVDAKESDAVLTPISKSDYYSKSKALAEAAVLAANDPRSLRTVSLRVASVYGERDVQAIPAALDAYRHDRHRVQIGDNKSLFDRVSVENTAVAHLLAARALLKCFTDASAPKVDGEAFFITDGNPIPFWDFQRKVWAAAGDHTPPERVRVLPAGLMLTLATVVEWFYWIVSFGRKKPKTFRRKYIEYACYPQTLSIQKARERLGYMPLDNRDESIRKAVKWQLQQDEENKRKKDA